MGKEEKKNKIKRPSALKRDIQNERRKERNKNFKTKAKTQIKIVKKAIEKKEETLTAELAKLYSLMDKGIKKGIIKKNKANKIKSRFALCSKPIQERRPSSEAI